MREKLLARAAATEPEVIARVQFLRDLMAAERGDTERLQEVAAALEAPHHAELRADHAELRGYLAMAATTGRQQCRRLMPLRLYAAGLWIISAWYGPWLRLATLRSPMGS
jgi:hypothetical protein